MRTDLFAIFPQQAEAHAAVAALLRQGAVASDISTLKSDADTEAAHHEGDAAPLVLEDIPAGPLAVTAVPGIGKLGGRGPFALAFMQAVSNSDAATDETDIREFLRRCRVEDGIANRIHEAYERGDIVVSICAPSGSLDVEEAQTLLHEYAGSVYKDEAEGAA